MRSGLGILLEQEIERRGLSVKEFAEGAGVSATVILRLVRGQQRSAKLPALERIAQFLGCEVWGLEMLGSESILGMVFISAWLGMRNFTPHWGHLAVRPA